MSDETLVNRTRSIKPGQGYVSSVEAKPVRVKAKEVKKSAANFWTKRGLKEPRGYWR